MKHSAILVEIPRILRELRLPQQARKPWQSPGHFSRAVDQCWQPSIEEIYAANDVIFRLCCDESLDMMESQLCVPRELIYAALVSVFQQRYPNAVPYGAKPDADFQVRR